jgi:uncharacterized glyoxalase superfamily protein PhnB
MKSNRSVPRATVIPVLTYPDVRAAVDWLCDVFGFKERLQIGENHRSQLSIGDGALIIADVSGDRKPPMHEGIDHQVMVRVEDVKSHSEHARKHGASIVMEPVDFPYGERTYEVVDYVGHHWIFTETLKDVNPKEWGGLLKK